jgi:orotidine-5'-phosphate decarboxylase
METPFLYVALDLAKSGDVYRAVEELMGVDSDRFGFKVNDDFIALNGAYAVKPVVVTGKDVFADLKMWKGRRTMITLAKYLDTTVGVKAVNAYVHAGVKDLSALGESLSDNCDLFGVTVLTHYTDDDCLRLYACDLRGAVSVLASIAEDAHCNGIILPGTTLDLVRDMEMKKVVPAIRPSWYEDKGANFQEQPVTPSEAIEGGADILVCGSPIMKSPDRKEALKKVLGEMGVY